MIGQLTFRVSTKRHTVTLSEDLAWQCDDTDITRYLSKTFPIHMAEGLSNLAVGRHALYQTAERLGGSVHVPARGTRSTPQAAELV